MNMKSIIALTMYIHVYISTYKAYSYTFFPSSCLALLMLFFLFTSFSSSSHNTHHLQPLYNKHSSQHKCHHINAAHNSTQPEVIGTMVLIWIRLFLCMILVIIYNGWRIYVWKSWMKSYVKYYFIISQNFWICKDMCVCVGWQITEEDVARFWKGLWICWNWDKYFLE